jgi:hypothetical protein
MNDNDLLKYLNESICNNIVTPKPPTSNENCYNDSHSNIIPFRKDESIIVSEIPITSGQLHSIAAGNYMIVGEKGEPFAIRFLLKSAHKLHNRNYVVKNIIMQIVAVGKDNAMRKEHIATDIKLKTIIKNQSKPKQEPKEEEIKINQSDKELF